MQRRTLVVIGAVVVILAAAALILVASQLTPQATNPAFTTAVDFVNAAGKGEDAVALALLDNTMKTYVADHCPNAAPSGCIQAYIPADWGGLLSAIYRRSVPDGQAWNVEIIANYAEGKGASGVCSLIRVEPNAGDWRVAGWAGFVHCGDPASRDMATNPDTPNRAP
ncbi:MAG: hypothetical protein GC204_18970 [Chloroflexi bacterium]|nr:hypothetical protein [Chloroflexota bacterium]